MYYGSGDPEGKDPHWFKETIVLTYAVFRALALPLAVLFGGVMGVLGVFLLLTIHPLLALGAIVAFVGVVALVDRRKRKKEPTPPAGY